MKKRGARLGQHFLTGHWAAVKLASAVAVRANETIIEVGPGKGALTTELLKTGARVIAVEKDEALVERLEHTFAKEMKNGQLSIVADDIRNFDSKFGAYVVAANIPYYITGEIIRQFLTMKNQPRTVALLVQKEVAQRIVAKKESILSLSVKAFGTPKIIAKVGRGNFSPAPSVDSAILVIDAISRNFFKDLDESRFFEIVRQGFSSKRKFLLNNLSRYGKEQVAHIFSELQIPHKIRAEDVHLETWRSLTKHLS